MTFWFAPSKRSLHSDDEMKASSADDDKRDFGPSVILNENRGIL